ncbi:MAG: hypothetical protein Q8Q92_00500 [bacterium]|nr:hypothetical protein [bacterium]
MKIVSSGRVLNSREFYEKKKKRRIIKLVLLFVGLLAFFSSLVYLSRQERFLITEVTVSGENVVGKEEIISRVKDLLRGRYLWIVPRTNALVFPRSTIKESLLAEFPRFKSVSLDLDGFHNLFISLEERIPFALYCAKIDTAECYFLDEDGFIFVLAPSFSSDAVYFVYTTEGSLVNPLGDRFMPVGEFKMLSSFIKNLAVLNVYPVGLEVGDDKYSLLLPKGGEILWRKTDNLTVIHSNLEAFLSNDSIRAQNNFLDNIIYLDLRTENKIFYKLKE